MKNLIWIATAILLAGCARGGGIGLEAMLADSTCEQQGFHLGTPEYASCRAEGGQSISRDQTCQQYGFKPGTPNYGNCRLELNRQAAAERRAFEANAWWNQPLPRQQTCTDGGNTSGGMTNGTMTCQ
jgi:hypothetical protein